MTSDALCSRPFLQSSQSRHEYASHLMPTRSPSLTGEFCVCAPMATTWPTPCRANAQRPKISDSKGGGEIGIDAPRARQSAGAWP